MKTKRVKKLLKKYFLWWVHWTGLEYWHCRMGFERKINKLPNNLWLGGYCTVEWKYQTARIVFCPRAMRHLTPEEIEATVVHEIMHIFLNEMREDGIDHEERAATQLQKAFMWVKGANK